MDQNNFQDNNSQFHPISPTKATEKEINNSNKSEIHNFNLNERNMSPSKPFENNNGYDSSSNDKGFYSSKTNNENKNISQEHSGKNLNDSRIRGVSIDSGNREEKIAYPPEATDRQTDHESSERYNIKKELVKKQSSDRRLSDPKANLDNDLSAQSSKNPSPILHESNYPDYNLNSNNPDHDDQYMSNRFFIDDTNESDHIKYSDNNINLFELTPDQQLAIRELELRKLQSDFEDDYDYSMNYDNIPEYDVKEKLESLNAQLASEPSPPEPEHRNSRVAFKEELVSLVAPAHEYPLSESEQEEYTDTPEYLRFHENRNENEIEIDSPSVSSNKTLDTSSTLETNKQENSSDDFESYSYERENYRSEKDPEPVNQPNVHLEINEKSTMKDQHETRIKSEKELKLETELKSEEKMKLLDDKNSEKELETNLNRETDQNANSDREIDIVVSRGGNFVLVDQSDMVDSSGKIVNPDEEILDPIDKHQTRPISAPTSKQNRNEVWSGMHSNSLNSSVRSEMNYQSKDSEKSFNKSGIPKVDKELLHRQKEREEKKLKEQQEREKLEQEEKRKINDACFKAWLQNKNKAQKEELERKKKEEEEERKKQEKINEENKEHEAETLKELAKNKELQKRREEKLRQYRIKEMEEAMVIHTKGQCKRAFREWVKNKKLSQQMKQNEEKQKSRITRLAMRQCRKSQNLAQAIHQANSFRYLDFIGYP